MREFIVEADGGSRGNPGPAGYGSVVLDPVTGGTLVEAAEYIGVATNNVAEYRGLIAGLKAAYQLDPAAAVRVRMDSKLVVEQMSGRWKIKHPDMKPLAAEAARVFPLGQVTYEWIPRDQNKHADRLANEAMDAGKRGERWSPSASTAELDTRASRAATPEPSGPPGDAVAGAARARAALAGARDATTGGHGSASRPAIVTDAAATPGTSPEVPGNASATSTTSTTSAGLRSADEALAGRAGAAEVADGAGRAAEVPGGPVNAADVPLSQGDAADTPADPARAPHAPSDSPLSVPSTRSTPPTGSSPAPAPSPAPASAGRSAGRAAEPGGEARTVSPTAATVPGAPRPGKAGADLRAARNVASAAPDLGAPATFVLLRHGETPLTPQKRFSGSGGSDPSLSDVGRYQAERVAAALATRGTIQDVVSSPLARCRETAGIVAARLGLGVTIDDGLRETDFGAWEGLSFGEVRERYPDDMNAWLASPDAEPTGGGESFEAVAHRVAATRDKLVAAHRGRTVLLVTHVTPIKTLVRLALGAPPESLFRMELSAASLSALAYYADGNATLRLLNDTSHLR
ncbi:bifunctional RNase H/acid phosphatase [Streptomyces sp. NPDC002787]